MENELDKRSEQTVQSGCIWWLIRFARSRMFISFCAEGIAGS